jgi:hypothetical protein
MAVHAHAGIRQVILVLFTIRIILGSTLYGLLAGELAPDTLPIGDGAVGVATVLSTLLIPCRGAGAILFMILSGYIADTTIHTITLPALGPTTTGVHIITAITMAITTVYMITTY